MSLPKRPDYTNTEPAADIGPFPQWADPEKIVSMDPWGHLTPSIFKDLMDADNRRFPSHEKFQVLVVHTDALVS